MNGIVNIHGKDYQTVAHRVRQFRDEHPTSCIETEILSANEDKVLMKAAIYKDKELVATGFAEEIRGSSNINKTSAVENCETSAIGRALASFGYIGESYASADEVGNAIAQQKVGEALEPILRSMEAIRENISSITAIKHLIHVHVTNGEDPETPNPLFEAVEVFARDITDDDKTALQLAPSKGGVFTTKERAVMKSDEWSQARKEYYGND